MARYDSMRKPERDRQIKDYAGEHPDESLKEIGKAFGVSAGRVWQILKRLKATTPKAAA